MTSQPAIGIDLGTTYSAIAQVDDQNRSRIVPNAEGDLKTPSVAYFEDERVIVGREAKRLGVYAVDRLAELAKRDMGKPFFSKPIAGRHLPPEVIQAYILRKLRNDLVDVAGDPVRAVVTVPAFFDEPRRKATVDAAAIAGIEVLDIVNEPTAAALAFGEHLGYISLGDKATVNERETMNILVYDLGGGTFDVTIIELSDGDLRTIGTDGDMQLGGRDWDSCLVDRVAEAFIRSQGPDPRQDPLASSRLFAACEEAKHTLSARNAATIRVTYSGIETEHRVTRDEFEEDTAHLLERTAYVTRQLLTTAGLQWKDLSRILLVGGSTRMPMVAEMLADRTGIVPDHSVNPDEAVARGAALYARFLLDSAEDSPNQPRFSVTNVNSHSLGIEGIDSQSGRRCNNIIIPRNTPLPARKTERFVTRQAGQTSVVVKVLEGESSVPTECTPIGKTVIRDLPGDLPGGTRILVTYEYGTNGRLNVWAKVKGMERVTKLELERENSLSSDLVERWQKLVTQGAGLAAFSGLGDSTATTPADDDPARAPTPNNAATAPSSAQAYGSTPSPNTGQGRTPVQGNGLMPPRGALKRDPGVTPQTVAQPTGVGSQPTQAQPVAWADGAGPSTMESHAPPQPVMVPQHTPSATPATHPAQPRSADAVPQRIAAASAQPATSHEPSASEGLPGWLLWMIPVAAAVVMLLLWIALR